MKWHKTLCCWSGCFQALERDGGGEQPLQPLCGVAEPWGPSQGTPGSGGACSQQPCWSTGPVLSSQSCWALGPSCCLFLKYLAAVL